MSKIASLQYKDIILHFANYRGKTFLKMQQLNKV